MNRSLRITVAFLGAYAGLLAIQHGIFAMLQGSPAPELVCPCTAAPLQ
jgi:hypothetical protein